MNFSLEPIDTEEIEARLAKAKTVHPMEPCRVGMYAGALEEIVRLRRQPRKGFSVAIERKDGSTFLACSNPGLLPAVFRVRKQAVRYKGDLIAHGFKCRVVVVKFTDPEEV